ncbi:hypothetical protein GCM10022381_20630 [Leifsonia kafniensis]|uniref:SMI1/KNR4 family protein n=1 Tax=Leifsonia kafniensis TaxID=475957 RepID=A0ABP7KI33_9MICO
MSLSEELARFDDVLADVFPEGFESMGEGLGDAGIERLRRAVAPFTLGAEVEQLYRWHDGSVLPVFGGKRFLCTTEIILNRAFHLSLSGRTPAWLQFTDGPEYYFATLDVAGCDPVASVWCANTHDIGISRMHDSLEAMIGTFIDMGETPTLSAEQRTALLLGGLRYDDEYRLIRSPGAYDRPNPPPGTFIMLFDEGTPEPWIRSLGSSTDELLPRGATTTVAELIRHAELHGEASGTIQGLTTHVGGPLHAIGFSIDDGTGALSFVADDKRLILGPVSQTRIEADVFLAPDGRCQLRALRRSPDWVA